MLIGHQALVEYFAVNSEHQTIAQAYCFVGASQVGKRTLARQLAAGLLRVPEEKLVTHPDFAYIERLEDEKTGKLKKDVSIAQARQIKDRLSQRSWMGGYQIVVIDEVELLNEEAGNALLKTLEEPTSKSIIFLLTENDQALLPTIKSRCQLLYFSLVPHDMLVQGLVARGYDAETAESVARLSLGRPGRAIQLAENNELRQGLFAELDRFAKLLHQPLYKKRSLLSDMFSEKEDGVRGRERVMELFDIWAIAWRDLLMKRLEVATATRPLLSSTVMSSHSVPHIMRTMEHLREAKKNLRHNGNLELVLESVVLCF